jgi:GT2 family glycosyltransferase
MTHVAVVILNYNGEALLRQFLPSVIQHSEGASIIVADNGSTDQSVPIIHEHFPSVEVLKLDRNYGFCGGYNRALSQVKSDYFVLLNSDVEVTAGWLNPMIDLLDKNLSIAAVQPKILAYNQRDHFEYAGAGGGYIDSLGYPFCRGRLFDFTEKDLGQYDDERAVFWASGACLCIRSSLYHKAGGLDESFFAHMEEIDLCWRIHRMGYQVYYTGKSKVYHVGAGTLSRSNPRKTYYNFRNGLSLLFKHLPLMHLLIKLPVRIALDWVAALKFLAGQTPADARAVVQAHIDFIRTLQRTIKARKELMVKFPTNMANTYSGVIPWQYYILKKKKILI